MNIKHALRGFKLAALWLSIAGIAEVGCGPKVPEVTALTIEEAANPTANFQKGIEYLSKSKDYSQAYTSFQTAAELFDAQGDKAKGAKAHFNAAWAAEQINKKPDAEKHYKLAFDADPAYEKAMYSYARLLTENGKAADAVTLYRAQADKVPGDFAKRNELISALTDAKMYDEALKEASDILLVDPKNATTYRQLAGLYYAQGNLGMAQLCAEKSLALNEGDPGTYNNLGVTLIVEGQNAAAIDRFKTAVKLDADNFEANMNLGWVALDSGDYALAAHSFEEATKADPTSVDAKLGHAIALRGTDTDGDGNKEFAQASTLYDEVIKNDPKKSVGYFNASILHARYTKDYEKSLRYLQAYVDANTGTVGPNDEAFKRMEDVKKLQAEEKARKEELARIEKEKKDREERALAAIKELDALGKDMKAKMDGCAALPAELKEELGMMLEQVTSVVDSKDTGMATDTKSMVTDYYGPMLADGLAAAGCAAPAPAEPTEPAPGGAAPG